VDEPGRVPTRSAVRGRSDRAFGWRSSACASPDANDQRQVPAAMALIEPGSGSGFAAAPDTVRVHGGCGYCTEYSVGRRVDDASPVMGRVSTSEIQRQVFARQLVQRLPVAS
jgi:alkylation response protein AidB-like acyl-CoA dehydrogenase